MEDDDEFGDLYTDVLTTFPSSSSSSAAASNLASHPASCPPIDLNFQSQHMDVDVSNSNFTTTMKLDAGVHVHVNLVENPSQEVQDAHNKVIINSRVLQSAHFDSPQQREQHPEKQLDDFRYEFDDKQQNANREDDFGMEPHIPGLSTTHVAPTPAPAPAPTPAGDEWNSDTDSEDDLQIVLNDTDHNHGLMGMGMGMGMDANGMIIGSDDEDDDGEPLVILDDPSAAATTAGLQSVEEQVWGDEAGQSAEVKEAADASKVNNAGLPNAPKIGYSNYGYQPFHSQFKYVRPGAPPLPGAPSTSVAPGQVRAPVTVSNIIAGRGRGEWRPPGMKGPLTQKGFHPGFWGSNVPGRGLEFTLPSHKTVFDVDIDTFEEKPWKYPGVDESDFFNFGMNEEIWKEYCKQLELLRLESTMQSKIRVYESGRAEQDYDPDMPPELAAAAGNYDSTAENVETAKTGVELGDMAKGFTRVLPTLPTGRAIQVEIGSGERLPSVDTRPPRIRDSDAVIEIYLQDSCDDGNDTKENPGNNSSRDDDQVDVVDEDDPQCGNDYIDGSWRKSSSIISCADMNDKRDRFALERSPSDHLPGSKGDAASENIGSPNEERWMKEKELRSSPHMSSGDSALDRRSLDYRREDSIRSLEVEHSPELSSASPMEEAREGNLDGISVASEDVPANVESGKSMDDVDMVVPSNTSKHKHSIQSPKQKLISQAEPPANNDVEERAEFMASRNSDNSKATGSSRDNQKLREGIEVEAVQNGRSNHLSDFKKNHGEADHDLRRKDRDGRIEMERNYMLAKGREDYYSHRDWDPHSANLFHAKSESSDRRKEREYSEGSWQRRDDDPHGRRIWAEASRKERGDEMLSRRRGKVREVDRSDKDEYLHSRKVLDDGIWRGFHDKDAGLRYREKDDVSKSRHEILDDHYGKRRNDDENLRRVHVEKEDIILSHRDSNSSRRKRERDVLSQLKREDQPRVREKLDDLQSGRLKDEVWVQREKAEKQRGRDEWYRAKQSHEEIFPRREREGGRPPIRSSRNIEGNIWDSHGHSRGEDIKGHDKDAGRHLEQFKRRDRVEEELAVQHRGAEDFNARGNQFVNEGKRSREEKSSSRSNCAVDATGSQRFHEKKHKETLRKARDSEGHSTSVKSKKHHVDKNTTNALADLKGKCEQDHDIPLHNLAREGREGVSSDDEQHNSKRGRSKLERWASHKERDYESYSKSSSSKNKEIRKDKHTGSGSSSGFHDESVKKVESGDGNQPLASGKEVGGLEGKDGDEKAMDGHHLDTVEKLKRRSERFKLPLASEKDSPAIKMESESLPTSQNDNPTNVEVKQERPPRKRRWISS
ncbi:unnamed protein product [Amaranthus hypochondriacus]